jgi:putative DNA primase/helicase
MTNLDALKSSLLAQSKTLVSTWLPSGKPNGHEWVALNPTRPDRSLGSFSVNLRTGQWAEMNPKYAHKGTNLVSLYAYINQIEFEDAVKALESGNPNLIPTQSQPIPQPKIIEPKVPLVMPVPPDAPPAPLYHYQLGRSSIRYVYSDVKGNLCGYVDRWNYDEPVNGRLKDFRPLFYSKKDGWVYNAPSPKKPIYGAEKLAQHPHAKVLIVEGEKACDAAQRLLPDWVCLSWLGGSNTAAVADWGIIKKREVYLWPDNDGAGTTAMQSAQEALRKANKQVSIVDFQTTKDKWDLADAEAEGWTREQVLAVIDTEVMPDEIGEAVSVASNPWFECLGFQNEPEDKCWYYSHRASALRSFTPASFDQKKMLTMATDDQWKQMIHKNVADKGAVNTAFEMVFAECSKKGIFNPDCSRKIGLWHDDGRIVANMGDYLIVDGKKTAMMLNSKFIYEHTSKSEIDCEPATVEETSQIADVCCMLNMTPFECWFLVGWIWLAPVCGVLNWRPTLWITGEAGSGKTTILSRILKPLLDDFCFSGESSTTEAGIRHKLNGRVVPALFDEAEMESKKAAYTIKEVLRLARGSSSKDGSTIIKGSATGEAKRYTIRSMFCFLSIMSGATEISDLTRVTALWVKKDSKEGAEKRFNDLCHLFDTVMTKEMGHKMIMRSILEVRTTLKVVDMFVNYISAETNERRLADQIGPLLAGCWMMNNATLPTNTDIKTMVDEVNWQRLAQRTFDSDHASALSHLLSTRIEHQEDESPIRKMIVSELISKILIQNESTANSESLPELLSLNRVGIHLIPKSGVLRISKKNPELAKLFKDTPWVINWNDTMRNIAGAVEHKDPMAMGRGFKKDRCLDIPLGATGLDEAGNYPIPQATPATPAKAAPVKYKIEEDPPF